MWSLSGYQDGNKNATARRRDGIGTGDGNERGTLDAVLQAVVFISKTIY
jgi:hypothetical protein